MKKIARISTAAFLAGVTTLAVSLPMPAAAGARTSSISTQRIADLPVATEVASSEKE